MLPAKHRLRQKKDIDLVLKKGKNVYDRVNGFRFRKNELGESRFAIVVGTKVSKHAVERNRLRRQYRDIVHRHLEEICPGFDIVVFLSKTGLELSFEEKEKGLLSLFRRVGLYEKKAT